MRHVLWSLLILCPQLDAQAPLADTAALMNEVHELRLAIERSTLLGARTQIAIQRLQTQSDRVTQAEKKYDEARGETAEYQQVRRDMASMIKQEEAAVQFTTNPNSRRERETRIANMKQQIADTSGEAPLRAKESDAMIQLQNEQAAFTRLQSDISNMESILDRAIQQLTQTR